MLTKEQKINTLRQQVYEIQKIKTISEFKKWRRDTEIAIENIFGVGTRHAKDFSDAFFVWDISVDYSTVSDFPKMLSNKSDVNAVLHSFISEVEKIDDGATVLAAKNNLVAIENLCRRFHLVARQLRSRHDGRDTINIEDEYDVQDLFHALLILEFNDIRSEEWTPSYAGSASRTDFLLKQEQIVVEIKKTRKDLGAKQIGEQLIIDIKRYKSHPDCKALICFVYDPEGRITNPRGIENDLNGEHERVDVKVIIAPSGV